MCDILCMYYSRTGDTKKTMEEIAQALDAELVELNDDIKRDGVLGWLRCGMDAVRRTTEPLQPYETARPLSAYRLVIVGSPIWAGRCSSVVRSFLKTDGKKLNNVAYVLLRAGEGKQEEAFEQMDLYTSNPRVAGVSLRRDSVGYAFWLEEFLRQIREFLEQQ